jgi:photoactive yellow protein
MTNSVAFDDTDLAASLERLTPDEVDVLSFGVIGLDPHGVVRLYSQTEARLSGRKSRPTVGLDFFGDVAPCMNSDYFKGRIEKARQAGTLNISFTFVGDFADRQRELSVRVVSASDGGLWLCHRRNGSDRPADSVSAA